MGSNCLGMRCEVDRGLGEDERKLGEEGKGFRGGRGCSGLSWDGGGVIDWVGGMGSWGYRGRGVMELVGGRGMVEGE